MEAGNGEWYLAHLCGRPLEWREQPRRRRPRSLRRPALPAGPRDRAAAGDVNRRGLAAARVRSDPRRCPRNCHRPCAAARAGRARTRRATRSTRVCCPATSNSLRVPFDPSWISLSERPGFLRLRGRESLMSQFDPEPRGAAPAALPLRGRRTVVEFDPERLPADGRPRGVLQHAEPRVPARHVRRGGRRACCGCRSNDSGLPSEPAGPVPLGSAKRVALKVRFDGPVFRFAYALDEERVDGPRR